MGENQRLLEDGLGPELKGLSRMENLGRELPESVALRSKTFKKLGDLQYPLKLGIGIQQS